MSSSVLILSPITAFNGPSCPENGRIASYRPIYRNQRRVEVVVCHGNGKGMLSQRKFMQRRRKTQVYKDAADEADQKKWRRVMLEIDETGSALPVLKTRITSNESLPKHLVIGTLVRLKQLKKWNLVSEILEWLRTQHWWDFNETDYVMLITAYGKEGNYTKAEKIMCYINKNGFLPNVVSYTALMEAYGRGGQYSVADSLFRRMQISGPEPSALTYQIILKIFVEGNKFDEAELIFENLMKDDKSPLKPDQKMFHMMIYMHRKAGSYEKAYRLFCLMAERGIERSTVTFNSLMSFETNYKEVSRIYDQMQRAGLRPDVVSYASLIHAYGKARREEEAKAVFEEMLDAGVRPTHKAYNILLDAFAISGLVDEAREVFKCMRRDRYTPDLCSYTTLLSAYINASDMDGAEKFFKRLRQDGLEPNVVTYGNLIKGYAKANNLEKLMEKYEEMMKCQIKPNQTIFTTIMDAYGKNKDFGSALHWFKEMLVHGCPPDQKAKNILLSLATTKEEQIEANEIVGIKADDLISRLSVSDDEDDASDSDCSSDELDDPTHYEEKEELIVS